MREAIRTMGEVGLDQATQDRLLREAGALLEERSRRSSVSYVALLTVLGLSSTYVSDHPRTFIGWYLAFMLALGLRVAGCAAWRRRGHAPRDRALLFAAPLIGAALMLAGFTAWTSFLYPSHWLTLVAHMAVGFGALSAIIAFAPARATTLAFALALVVPANLGTAAAGAAAAPMLLLMAGVFLAAVLPMLFRLSRDYWSAAIGRAVLQAESRRKSDFLATVSHELRTPLNGMLGTAELLLRGPLSSEQHEAARTLKTSTDALALLANDLLDAAAIEAGQLRVVLEPFSARALFTSVVELLAPEAAKKQLALALDVDEALPDDLVGDALRLRQVVVNLVGNAIKYTDRGSVHLTVRAAPTGPLGVDLHVTVEDTGRGFDPSELAGMFARFARGNASARGTGLGLGIAKELVERMGGTLAARGAKAQGATFALTLPLGVAAAAEGPSADAGRTLRGARVLLVDDNDVNLFVARALLEHMGCAVTTATTGDGAVAAARAQPFDVVLMDLHMPGMDGYAATTAIRAAESGRRTPVVAVTAAQSDEARARCLAVGMDDLVLKPVTPDALVRAVAPLLDRALTPRAPARPSA